jgi:hypothetical protein
MHEGEFNIHGSHLWTWDNLHVICKCGINFTSLSAFRLKSSEILQTSATWQTDCWMMSWFSRNCSTGVLVDAPLPVGQRLWFQYNGAPVQYGEHARLWMKAT